MIQKTIMAILALILKSNSGQHLNAQGQLDTKKNKEANLKDMGDHGLINMKIEDICKTKISNCLLHSFRCITDLLLPVKYKSLCISNKMLSRII